ncbi:cytoplasmic protein [Arthrobacter crystallopoietes BAB-32]|uniref:Cytoplasmic protein n=1 Tax=Arthrobacter crystallopoietes BAB-32 TaxID=1246476 RepID=N1VAR2_9MICC|nr:BREX-1 system phosphatase PglZ type B [Arthrobacter crystallopoietes]EMY35393.1 cytoplasmic protein [Arthrobacter crystallopoietes BAB-32]
MDDPEAVEKSMALSRWNAFCGLAASQYGVDPRKDSVLTAGALLGAREGNWKHVWARFVENPKKFPHVPELLDQSKSNSGTLFEMGGYPDSWPSDNQDAEQLLRSRLADLGAETAAEAADAIRALESIHGQRRDWVWSALGLSPLAQALEFLMDIVLQTETGASSGSVDDQAAWYFTSGWTIDDAAVRALASARTTADRTAVAAALTSLYGTWLEDMASRFQNAAVSSGYQGQTGLEVHSGTCVIFVDGLRMDIGQRLQSELAARGIETGIDYRLAAFPTVTPTGKPAVAPLTINIGSGPGFAAGNENGIGLEGTAFQKALEASAVQKVPNDALGDPSGRGWTEIGDLDSSGHSHGHKLVDRIDAEITLVADRIQVLLEAGWKRVVTVTDHGWLLAPQVLRKVEPVPMHLTEGEKSRKDRVARLSTAASGSTYPTVPWTWDSSVSMTSAPGTGSFETGVVYTHGGLSLQECVIPVLSATGAGKATFEAKLEALKWTGMRCRIDVADAVEGMSVEIRTASGDAASSVAGPKLLRDGEAKLLVADDGLLNQPVFVVLLDPAGKIVGQAKTAVGGEA